jgi:hypothetical protein
MIIGNKERLVLINDILTLPRFQTPSAVPDLPIGSAFTTGGRWKCV